MEISRANALAIQAKGDTAMAEAQRLNATANALLHQAEIQFHIAIENWSRANSITLALDHIAEQNSEK